MKQNKIFNIYFTDVIEDYIKIFKAKYNTDEFIPYNSNIENAYDIGSILILDYKTIKKDISILSNCENMYCIAIVGIDDNIDEKILSPDFIKTILENNFSYISFEKSLLLSINYFIENIKSSKTSSENISLLEKKLDILYEVGIALSDEKDVNKIINMILIKAKEMTNSDAGSIWILEKRNEEKYISLKYSYNDTSKMDFTQFTIPLNKHSISGYVVDTGECLILDDVYNINSDSKFSFNKDVDIKSNYKTISMMVVPLKNNKNKVLGALQLINRKTIKESLPNNLADFKDYVINYDKDLLSLIQAFASQATMSLENAMLYEMLKNSFESFLAASVAAIEARDTITSGHTHRVIVYTLVLAMAVNENNESIYKDVFFNDQQMEEIKYAALLHDIGKVSVKESILMKEKKLYPYQMCDIAKRVEEAKHQYANKLLNKIDFLLPDEDIEDIKKSYNKYISNLNDSLNEIKKLNEPSVFDSNRNDLLNNILNVTYSNESGTLLPILEEDEISSLKTLRGSLTNEERILMQEHVIHTKKFLEQIAWPADLINVTDIASKHHEYLDGSGYPDGIDEKEISIQTRIMTIADIYDSLTASDRPYKKSLSIEKSLSVLNEEAENGKLDIELVRIFTRLLS